MRLAAVRLPHTLIWAFCAGCILAISLLAWCGRHALAVPVIAVVLVEVPVVLFNAARYTGDRRDSFEFCLREWLARHHQLIFGTPPARRKTPWPSCCAGPTRLPRSTTRCARASRCGSSRGMIPPAPDRRVERPPDRRGDSIRIP